MSIRGKLFLLLLAFSLMPLMAVTAVSQWGANRLGRILSGTAEDRLTRVVSAELLQSSQRAQNAFFHNAQTLKMALPLLAGEVERSLQTDGRPAGRIYFDHDFDASQTAPPDLAPSARFRFAGWGRAMPVSFAHPVFRLAPGVAEGAVSRDIHRLAAVSPVLKNIFEDLTPVVNRLYVSLESGVHMAFPGHGSYPQDFDPRKRPWYQAARQQETVTWSSLTDLVTGQAVFSVAAPLRAADGGFAGTVGADILMTEALMLEPLHSQWADVMEVLLVRVEPAPAKGAPNLIVLAAKTRAESPTARENAAPLGLGSADRAGLQTLAGRLQAGEAGTMELPYRGADAIWAWSARTVPSGGRYGFIVVVPKASITTMPAEAGAGVMALTRSLYLGIGAVALILVAVAGLVAAVSAGSFTRPIRQLVGAYQRLAGGDFTVRVDLKSGDERDTLFRAFNLTVPRLEAYIQTRKSLELAREVQQRLLPAAPPRLPGVDICGASSYCDETGGDFYDIQQATSGERSALCVAVGDVSGHGVAAALLMATARALLRGTAGGVDDLGARVSRVNRLLTADTGASGNFLTLFCLEVDCGLAEIRWVRGGHDPALWYDAAADRFEALDGNGMALGVDETTAFNTRRMPAPATGQVIAIGTDGIWEARNADGDVFGKKRLQEVIRTHAGGSAREIQAAVFEAVAAFRGQQRQEDDITLVVVKFGEAPAA